MFRFLTNIGTWIGTGPLAPAAVGLAILTTLVALAILIMELSGRTISHRKIVRRNFRWDLPAYLVMLGTAFVVILVNPVQLNFIHLGSSSSMEGMMLAMMGGPKLLPSLAPVIAVVFGLPGILGFMLGIFISNLSPGISLSVLFAAFWSALSWIWVTWLPYKMVGRVNFSTVPAGLLTLGRFYLWAVIVGPLIHLWSSPGLSVLMGGNPSQVWSSMIPMILINHDLAFLFVAPIALLILYPLARLGHLYWWDRQQAVVAA